MGRGRGTEYTRERVINILQEVENEMATIEISFLRIRSLYNKFRLLNGARDRPFVRRIRGFNAPQMSDIDKYKRERREGRQYADLTEIETANQRRCPKCGKPICDSWGDSFKTWIDWCKCNTWDVLEKRGD